MPPRQLLELSSREKRRAFIRTGLAVGIAWAVLVGVYYALPAGPDSKVFDVLRLVLGLVFLAIVLGWQTSHILTSELPEMRAIQSLGVILPLFFVLFASAYLSLSDTSRGMFNVTLNHTESLYFTVTVFATVGFGDIVPTTGTTQLLVTLQMLLDLVFIGVVVRILVNTAQRTLASRGTGTQSVGPPTPSAGPIVAGEAGADS